MSSTNWLELGAIDRVHGLKGAVVVRLAKGIVLNRYLPLSTFFLKSGSTKVPYPVVRHSPPVQGGAVVWLGDVNGREAAQRLVGSAVWILTANKPGTKIQSPLQMLTDCLDYRIRLQLTDEICGEEAYLSDVREMPGQIMMEITEDWGAWLCPYQPAFVGLVDHDARILELNPPEGLRAIYYTGNEG